MDPAPSSLQEVGRYSLYCEIASGGMATVYVGRLNAAGGFGRIVAIKRLHAQFARDPEFVDMFLDEARLTTRIHHPNVVPTLDVVSSEGELFVVMEYVRGESLAKLWRAANQAGGRIPQPIVTTIASGVLQGLHAAHEAKDERGQPLGIVHRDVSPQNVIVGEDGVARVLDFGVAKAASRLHQTREGQVKGKLAYMAPEQIAESEVVSNRCDIYAAGIVLWEALAGRHLFRGKTDGETMHRILNRDVDPPSAHNPEVEPALDAVVMRALAPEPADRFATGREMAVALEAAVRGASAIEVGQWVQEMAAATLQSRHEKVRDIESGSVDSLSGFPVLPRGALAEDHSSQPSSVRTGVPLSTAVTVRSDVRLVAPPRRRQWPALVGLGAVAAVAIGFALAGRLSEPLPPAPSAAALEPAPTAAATAPSASATASAPSATTSGGGSAGTSSATVAATASSAASSPEVIAAPAVTRPPTAKRPPTKAPSGNDIDSLIETRK